MITLLTPTGDRPEAFALCEYWMSRQTVWPDPQWLVIDDGQTPTHPTQGQQYLRREPQKSDPSHTLGLNLLHAIPHIKGDKVLVIEDDDYYSPQYLETMLNWLDEADLVGERGAKYYFLQDSSYYFWPDHQHASLCRTGMKGAALAHLPRAIASLTPGDWRIDLRLWETFRGKSQLHDTSVKGEALCVGIKQLPGRAGVTHRKYPRAIDDPKGSRFSEWLGNDALPYRRFLGNSSSEECVFYTCIFGDYDNLPDCVISGAVLVTDKIPENPKGWEILVPEQKFATPKLASRYWKMHPHLLFPNTDTLYFDANLRFRKNPVELLTHMRRASPEAAFILFRHNKHKTIQEEANEVVRQGFGKVSNTQTELVRQNPNLPTGWGGCLFRRKTSEASDVGELWWEMFQTHSRDQLVLPIALRDSGVSYLMLDEPTPFYGQQCEWFTTVKHRKPRSKE